MSSAANPRQLIIRLIITGITLIMLGRLFYLQAFEDKYKIMADDITIYKKIVYPPRGAIVDRNGKNMLINRVAYDLVVTPNKVKASLDTLSLCMALDIDRATFERLLYRTRIRNGYMRMGTFMEHLSPGQTARFQENMYLFDGFELIERTIREYPDRSAALLLGYVGEVSAGMLKQPKYLSYNQGDYTGMSGLERSYEDVLRGQRGVYYFERDNFNRPRESYKKGALDTPAIAGKTLKLYLDADLQLYAEQLMANKIGSVVAIDPQTGGILTMVSSPGYDPNLLRGRERSRNYAMLERDPKHPLFNRATQAAYQPGSALKPMTALVALDAGAITPSYGYPCFGGYYQCGRRIGCTHSGGGHAANLRAALANSCNAYFVHILRLTVDHKKYGGVKKGVQKWHDYFEDFGFGHPTGIDIPFEKGGLLPDSAYYNKKYNGSWNSCTMLFVGMGQGEIALTPLQLANAMCIIANKGYYYKPHLVQAIGDNPQDPLLFPYLEKHKVTNIPDSAFAVVGKGLQDVVDRGTGRVAQLPGIEICAKTGTVENKAVIGGQIVKMKDHSVFVAYAPRENPKIAIAVIVENAGYGATWAGPVASLVIEKYLRDTIASNRKHLEDKLLKANLINPYIDAIDAEQRKRDSIRYYTRIEQKRVNDSTRRAEDSILVRQWWEKHTGKKLPQILETKK